MDLHDWIKKALFDKAYVVPTNLSESKELDKMTEDLAEGVRVQADKGFFSTANKKMLKSKGLKNGLMYKAFRNKPVKQHLFCKIEKSGIKI